MVIKQPVDLGGGMIMNKTEPILIACEESGIVTEEFIKLGFTNVFSCDLMETSGNYPDHHICGDVIPLINGNCCFTTSDGVDHEIKTRFSLIIAFPPCTYLSNAGACRLYPKKGQLDLDRYQKGMEAKEFFLSLLNADCPRIAVENPVSSKVFGMPQHTQEIQPWQFGHPYTKKTRLWLKGLPMLKPTKIVEPVAPYCPAGTSRKDRSKYGTAKRGEDAKNRAKTFEGIATAMAEQWAGDISVSKEEN